MIPASWSRAKVAEVCRLQNGRGFKPADWSTSGYPIIRIQNLNGSDKFNYFRGTPEERWLVHPGQLLFAWAGSRGVSFGPTIWRGPLGVLNQHIFRVFPARGVDQSWLHLALRYVTEKIESKAHGFKDTLVHVRKSEIDDYEVLVPPLPEQRRIAEILSTWDRGVETLEALIANATKQKAALMQALLTRSTRLPGFNGEWNHRPLAAIATRVTRRNDGSNLPVLTISSTSGFVRQDEKYRREMAGKSVESYIVLNQGEFAYNKGNSKTYQFGCVYALTSYERALVPHVYVCFRLKRGYNPRFFGALFEADYLAPQLGRLVNTGVRNNGLLNITPKEVLGTIVPVPPADEQDAIAAVLEAASITVAQATAQLDAIHQEKTALMQQLLTGKRRVKPPTKKAATP